MDASEGAFGLLGPLVGWGSIALAVLAVVVSTVAVPRIIRRRERSGLRAALIQLVSLLLCIALAMLATGIWLNRSFVFFGQWGDILAGSGGKVTTEQFGGTPRETAHPAATPDGLARLHAAQSAAPPATATSPLTDAELKGITDSDDGQYIPVTFPSSASKLPANLSTGVVHLPAGYLQHPERPYPVIVALSGILGGPYTWQQVFRIGERVDAMAAKGEMASPIVVMPRVFPGTYDTECVDATAPGGNNYETWLTQDVTGWVKTHLRTVEDPLAWAAIGYSAGGWCAPMLAVRHPDLISTAVSLAGYYTPIYADGQQWAAQDDPRYDLPAIVAEQKPPVALYFFSGGQDALTEPSLGEMSKAVTAAGPTTMLTAERSEHGGHMVTLWQAHLGGALGWLAGVGAGLEVARRVSVG